MNFSLINNTFDYLLDFVYPKVCLLCNSRIGINSKFSFICEKCFYNLPVSPLSNEIIDRLLSTFEPDDIAISEAFALFSLKDNDFLNVIHSMKYEGLFKVGYEFGFELGNKLRNQNVSNYDGIIPVPIHSAKQRERGYNQSEQIALGISDSLKVPYRNDIIYRSKYTKSQTKLTAFQRKENISDVYNLYNNSSPIQNKTFLIVDDVFTTGSTINFLALKLLENGAKKVNCATIVVA